ncbi:MAG: hypothetical protein U5K69_08580 [Balneolaceae bacterium]|nr:hypothetical protein [Balneolaceae bacterium]
MTINGQQLVENSAGNRWWDADTATIDLTEGTHTITTAYFRGESGDPPVLSLMAEGPGIEKHALHAPSAFPAGLQDVDQPSIKDTDGKPILMHGFMEMPDRVHPHTAAIGYPEDIHVGMDLNNGSLLKLWKGEFLDVSTMWVGRGGGNLSLDEESALTFNGAPSLAFLDNRETAWPDSLQEQVSFDLQSYQFGEENQLILQYQVNDMQVEDQVAPHNGNRELLRTIHFSGGSSDNLYFRIAKGESISELPNGLFQINDKTYLINIGDETKGQTWVRRNGDVEELLVPITDIENATISYRYVW